MTRRIHNRLVGPLAVGLLASLAGANTSHAQYDPRTNPFTINDADPTAQVPTQQEALEAPLQMGYYIIELSDRAHAAEEQGDFEKAAQYFLAVGEAAPHRAVGFAEACESYEKGQLWDEASDACRQALGRDGVSAQDFFRFMRVTLQKKILTQTDADDLRAVFARAEERRLTPKAAKELVSHKCRLAIRTGTADELQTCRKSVLPWPKDDPMRLAYLSTIALYRNDFDGARTLVEEAKKARAPLRVTRRTDTQIEEAERAYEAEHALSVRAQRAWPYLMLFVLAALGVGGAVLGSRRRRAAQAA